MNHRLAQAVVATFREAAADVHYLRLATFGYSDWLGSYRWLDASGLALYFLARIKTLRIEDAIPVQVLQRLEENLGSNRERTADMFDEFVRINAAFQGAGLTYVNLKGFTLAPKVCPDAALRCQFDLDFMMAGCDVQHSVTLLKRHGYLLTAICDDVWEFKVGSGHLPSVHDLYKPQLQRSLEIHFASDDRLSRARMQTWNEIEFPALSECDKFVAQALHLFKHIRSEWTRTSWVLEYAMYLNSHRTDETLWQQVNDQLSEKAEARVAIGAVTLMADRTFGASIPALVAWTVQEMPWPVRLWIERYGDDVLLAEFPGTKLYLLLQGALSQDKPAWTLQRCRKLFPLHRPPAVVYATHGEGLLQRVKRICNQASYIWFRLRFHVSQGLYYMIEAPRWKRIVAGVQN